MAIFLTLFYIAAALLTPAALFGGLAAYHLQLVIAILTLIASLFAPGKSGLLRMPQTYAMFALVIAVAMSLLVTGWVGGTVAALLDFIPTSIVFFFIVLNFHTKSQFQMLVGMLFLVAASLVVQGGIAQATLDYYNPHVLMMKTGFGGHFFRIRGLGFLNDPNDLSQFLVALVPCMFFFYRKGRALGNLLLVYMPVVVLLYGMFLTHSRGGMVALLVMAMVLGYRRLGLIPSGIGAAILFVGISALGWSGGREVSVESGTDRTDAWGNGLGMIRSNPIFGVGYDRFKEHYVITAHNTVVVCAAEIGLVGFFFWMLLILTSIRDINVTAADPDRKKKAAEKAERDAFPTGVSFSLQPAVEGMPLARTSLGSYGGQGGATVMLPVLEDETKRNSVFDVFEPPAEEALPEAEYRRMGRIVMISVTGFLAAGWFLSRSYTMVLFLEMGLAAAVYRAALERQLVPPPLTFGKASKWAALTCLLLLVFVYLFLRVSNLIAK